MSMAPHTHTSSSTRNETEQPRTRQASKRCQVKCRVRTVEVACELPTVVADGLLPLIENFSGCFHVQLTPATTQCEVEVRAGQSSGTTQQQSQCQSCQSEPRPHPPVRPICTGSFDTTSAHNQHLHSTVKGFALARKSLCSCFVASVIPRSQAANRDGAYVRACVCV